MKYLIILGVLAFIFLLIYIRLRPYIRMARQMFGVARQVRNVARDGAGATATRASGVQDRLARCEGCGTWIPAARAIKLRSSNSSYCSHECLEAVAGGQQRKAAGG